MSGPERPIDVISRYPPHDGTFGAMLASRARVVPDQAFIVFEGATLTYRQAVDAVERTAAVLAARGLKPGDRLGVMSQNHPSTVMLLFAAARLGAIMVPANPDFGVAEAKYVMSHAGVSGVISAPATLQVVREAVAEIEPAPWLMLNEPDPGDAPLLADEIARVRGAAPPAAGDADTVCLFIYTSGTTGFPKGVMHSPRNILLAGEGFVERMWLQRDERLMCVLPMFHINAIMYSLAGTLAAGATLVLVRRFSASTFWKTVAENGVTEANTLAAVSSILMRRPRSEFVPGHRLRKVYGAPFTQEMIDFFRDQFQVTEMIEGYGMSEIPGVLNNPFEGPRKVGSMGKPSRHPDHGMAFAEMKVVDDDGRELPEDQPGELAVRTPIVMKGYYRDPEQTRAAFRDGWFLTGDLGYRDADGYFWFVARKKDIIRKRGENISGAELDRVIGGHPDVLEAAAIPVPSDMGDDDILVAVIPRPGAAPTAEDIAEWCRKHLAPIKAPRYVVFVDSLPHTPTHRVAKFKMRDDPTLRARAVDLGQ